MRSRLSILYLTVFIDLLGFGIVIPILPTYATELGASALEVGLIAALYSLMNFVFSPFWGTLSDRHGRRTVIAGTVAITACSFFLLAQANVLWLLFLARLVSGIGSANIAASQAYITDVTPKESRAKALGLIGAAFGLGFIFGPPVGGFVKEHFGMAYVGYMAMGLSTINLILVLLFLPESIKEKDPHAKLEFKPVTNAFRALKREGLRDLYITMFTYVAAFSMMQVTVALLWEQDYGLSEAQVGYMFAAIGLASAVVQGGMVGWLSRKFGEARLLVFGCILMAIGLGSIPFVPFDWFIPVAFLPIVMIALANGCMMPSITSLLSKEASDREQGQVLGMNQSFGSLARVIGPTIGGLFYGWSHYLPYLSGALVMGATLYAVLGYNRLRAARPA
ncbi:MAG: MFS transporter [Flavobacteriales bacterium]|nr:MFS transporter [Flavobacteriales bacterium]